MRLLDRYVLREVLLSSALATGAFMLVLLAGNLLQQVLGAVSMGRIDLADFAELSWLLVPSLLPYALPMGLLAGVLIGFGRMGADGELVAMRSAGMSLVRIAMPIWVAAGLMFLVCAALQLEVGPKAEHRFQEVLNRSAKSSPARLIVPGKLNRQFPGLLLRAGRTEGERLVDFRLWELGPDGAIVRSVKARSAVVSRSVSADGRPTLQVVLTDAESSDMAAKANSLGGGPESKAERALLIFPLDQGSSQSEVGFKRLRMMTAGELLDARDRGTRLPADATIAQREVDRMQLMVQLMFRLANAFSAFALPFLAVPLAVKVGRNDSNMNALIAVLVALGYYALTSAASWSKSPAWHPELTLWLPNFFVLIAGVVLIRGLDRR